MFGSNYFGQPYFGQGYAGITGAPVVELATIVSGVGTAVADMLRVAMLEVLAQGVATVLANLTAVSGAPGTGRLQVYDFVGRVTLEEP